LVLTEFNSSREMFCSGELMLVYGMGVAVGGRDVGVRVGSSVNVAASMNIVAVAVGVDDTAPDEQAGNKILPTIKRTEINFIEFFDIRDKTFFHVRHPWKMFSEVESHPE